VPPRRYTKRPEEVQKLFVEAMSLGMTVRLACEYSGISETTYYDWMARAEGRQHPSRGKGKPEHVAFAEAVKKATSKSAATLLARIRRAAEEPSKWQAAAWLLERRYPGEFGRVQRHISSDGWEDHIDYS
jgi:transposase